MMPQGALIFINDDMTALNYGIYPRPSFFNFLLQSIVK